MASYGIFETDGFRKDLKRFARSGLHRLQSNLLRYIYPQLRAEPHFGLNIRRLRNSDPPTWRYSIGSWRFFYQIDEKEKIIYMATADHRSSARGSSLTGSRAQSR